MRGSSDIQAQSQTMSELLYGADGITEGSHENDVTTRTALRS
jgi:hypothetical protein